MTSNVPTPAPPDTDFAVRDRIIYAARKLYLAAGFRRSTMDDLAAATGMSKKTLYKHFATKDELVHAVMQAKFADVEARLEAVLAQRGVPMPDQLRALLVGLQEEISEIHPAFVGDVEKSDPALFAFIDERRQQIIRKYFGTLLQRGRRQGVVRKDIPVGILLEMLIGSARRIVTPANLAQLNLSPQKAFQFVLSVFLEGILLEKIGK